jgi:hypothetical protein
MSAKNPVPQTQAYEGVRASTPPNFVSGKIVPNTSQFKNTKVGDMEVNSLTNNTYQLGGIAGGVASWYLVSGPAGNGAPVNVTATSQAIVAGNQYISANAALSTFTLPLTANVGDAFAIVGKGAGFWTIHQNAGQSIVLNAATTTSGTGGSITSTQAGNCINLVCTTANTVFTVTNISGAQSAYTIV